MDQIPETYTKYTGEIISYKIYIPLKPQKTVRAIMVTDNKQLI